MSAPQTNVETQAKRHRPALFGISSVLVYSTILLAAFLIFVTVRGGEPEGAETQIDSRTGDEVPADG